VRLLLYFSHFLFQLILTSFEPSQEARARAAAEGNTRPEDLIAIYRKRTHIDPSGRETETQARYFVVDSVEALGKFGADAYMAIESDQLHIRKLFSLQWPPSVGTPATTFE
jgi:hypothetical protein